MRVSSSREWRLAEPAAGEAEAGRETSETRRSSSGTRLTAMKGHGPWLAGSSCAHTTSAFGYLASSARISSLGSG